VPADDRPSSKRHAARDRTSSLRYAARPPIRRGIRGRLPRILLPGDIAAVPARCDCLNCRLKPAGTLAMPVAGFKWDPRKALAKRDSGLARTALRSKTRRRCAAARRFTPEEGQTRADVRRGSSLSGSPPPYVRQGAARPLPPYWLQNPGAPRRGRTRPSPRPGRGP
jgi:hypothetical protein